MKTLLLMSSLLVLIGCISVPRNEVSEVFNSGEALVKIDAQGFKAGDKLHILKEFCRESFRKDISTTKCTQAIVGRATITELKSQDLALIKADSDTKLESGMLAEKISQ